MKQLLLFEEDERKLMNLKDASAWASEYLQRQVTNSNISYLIQYGRIQKYGTNGNPLINLDELKDYYDSVAQENQYKTQLSDDINWHLSFTEYTESERTKHIHRLHPYKGKFIPQLVAYFLDDHQDEFKKQCYFNTGDIVLDPFCGSGTTLIQANELGIHAIGIDISTFNSLISNAKLAKYDISLLRDYIHILTSKLRDFQSNQNYVSFEEHLTRELAKFNLQYFPSSEYKRKVRTGEIKEKEFGLEQEKKNLDIYFALGETYQIKIQLAENNSFLDKWFLAPVRGEIDFLAENIKIIKDEQIKQILRIILSRTIRSCRATTHADLGTLKEPVTTTYYCKKHGKICRPIFSILGWWETYTIDTIKRLKEFDKLRSDTYQICVTGDSRNIDLYTEIKHINPQFAQILSSQKIRGIFSSPPYVGLIDYHEQHAYSYEIFGLERKDELEIGTLSKGQGKKAKDAYVYDLAEVLKNCQNYLQNDFDIFLVANDKYNLYPQIAELSQLQIVNQFKRPVLNRVEKNRASVYSETIFHLKEK